MKIFKNILFLAIVALAAALPARGAEVAHFLLERQMAEDRQAEAQAKKLKAIDTAKPAPVAQQVRPVVTQPQPKVVAVEQKVAVEPKEEDFSPFSSVRAAAYRYGSIIFSAAQDALGEAAYNEEEELNPEEIARQAVAPALLTLPVDVLMHAGKKASKAAIGEDLVSPLGDTISKVTVSTIASHYNPEVRRMSKRDVAESFATDILYALPKYTLQCALKEGLGWGLGYPFKKSLDTWTGTFHAIVGDFIEGTAKRAIKFFLQHFVVEDAAHDMFGQKIYA